MKSYFIKKQINISDFILQKPSHTCNILNEELFISKYANFEPTC